MNIIRKTITSTVAILFIAAAILTAGYFAYQYNLAVGSVEQGSEYTATLVNSSDRGTSTVKSTYGTLGSVIVASTSSLSTAGPYIAFYDTASTTIATSSMTAVVEIGAKGATTIPIGTYTYDVAFGQGIFMWVDPAFSGHYTVTYR